MQEAEMKLHLTLAWFFILLKLFTMGMEWNEWFQPPRLAVWRHSVLVEAKYVGDNTCRINEVLLSDAVAYRPIGRVLCSELNFKQAGIGIQ